MRASGSRLVWIGGSVVAALLLIAALAPVLAPYDPKAFVGESLEPASHSHLLGTNNLGRDILSQLIWGARTSLFVAASAATLAIGLGTVVGATAVLAGGWTERIAMRVIDGFLALPVFPLLLVVGAVAGPNLIVLTIVIGLIGWPGTARVLAAQTRSLRQRGYIRASQGFGGGFRHLIGRHLAPALGPLISSNFAQFAAVAILLESGLGFLGLGDPTAVSWGRLLNDALGYRGLYLSNLWVRWVLPPGFAISLAVLGFTFLAVGMDIRFNPRAARTL